MNGHFIQCSFKITPTLKAALKAEARRLGVTETSVIRHILCTSLNIDNPPVRWGGNRRTKENS